VRDETWRERESRAEKEPVDVLLDQARVAELAMGLAEAAGLLLALDGEEGVEGSIGEMEVGDGAGIISTSNCIIISSSSISRSRIRSSRSRRMKGGRRRTSEERADGFVHRCFHGCENLEQCCSAKKKKKKKKKKKMMMMMMMKEI
jgi:hypothetical protein